MPTGLRIVGTVSGTIGIIAGIHRTTTGIMGTIMEIMRTCFGNKGTSIETVGTAVGSVLKRMGIAGTYYRITGTTKKVMEQLLELSG